MIRPRSGEPFRSQFAAPMVTGAPNTEIVLFDGFDDLDAIAPLEVLHTAGFEVRVVGTGSGSATVRSAHGLRLTVPEPLGDDAELVIVPGGGWIDPTPDGARAQCDGPLPARLAHLHARGVVIASVCTGAMLLAAAGLLDGRPAVTNHGALDDLAAAGALVRSDARVVDDGDVVTSGGPGAAIDLGLHLVGRYLGVDAARKLALELEHHPVGLPGLSRLDGPAV